MVRQYLGKYTRHLRETLWELHEFTRRRVRDATLQTKRHYDIRAKPVDLRPNDIVWLFNPKKRRGLSRKLQTQWEGPYTVVKAISDVVFQIRKSPKSPIQTVHADRLRLVERSSPDLPPPKVPFDSRRVSTNFQAEMSRKRNARRVFPLLRVTVSALEKPEPPPSSHQTLSSRFGGATKRLQGDTFIPVQTIHVEVPAVENIAIASETQVQSQANQYSVRRITVIPTQKIFIPTPTSIRSRRASHLMGTGERRKHAVRLSVSTLEQLTVPTEPVEAKGAKLTHRGRAGRCQRGNSGRHGEERLLSAPNQSGLCTANEGNFHWAMIQTLSKQSQHPTQLPSYQPELERQLRK